MIKIKKWKARPVEVRPREVYNWFFYISKNKELVWAKVLHYIINGIKGQKKFWHKEMTKHAALKSSSDHNF